jgi:hypothetical protein
MERMEKSSTRLVIYSTLWILGVALMLLGITWLMFLGLTLIMLAESFSHRYRARDRTFRVVTVCIFGAITVRFLIRDLHRGVAFVLNAQPLWFWIALLGVWLWAVLSEFHQWRKSRVST